MKASDFIFQVKDDLQEKSPHWSMESLLLKLQRAYIDIQSDLPYFVTTEEVAIKEGQSEYYLKEYFLKDVSFCIGADRWKYVKIDDLFISSVSQKVYTYHQNTIMLNQTPKKDATAKIVYRYRRAIKSMNCYIEIPEDYHTALAHLLKAYIYEKPTRNTKERDLNKHYLNLYAIKKNDIKNNKPRSKNITSKFQIC